MCLEGSLYEVHCITFTLVVLQLISVAFEHSVLRVREIYALENAVFAL